MESEIVLLAFVFHRSHSAANGVFCLKNRNLMACTFKSEGNGKTGDAGTNHPDVHPFNPVISPFRHRGG
jgi:hypothetical protein